MTQITIQLLAASLITIHFSIANLPRIYHSIWNLLENTRLNARVTQEKHGKREREREKKKRNVERRAKLQTLFRQWSIERSRARTFRKILVFLPDLPASCRQSLGQTNWNVMSAIFLLASMQKPIARGSRGNPNRSNFTRKKYGLFFFFSLSLVSTIRFDEREMSRNADYSGTKACSFVELLNRGQRDTIGVEKVLVVFNEKL